MFPSTQPLADWEVCSAFGQFWSAPPPPGSPATGTSRGCHASRGTLRRRAFALLPTLTARRQARAASAPDLSAYWSLHLGKPKVRWRKSPRPSSASVTEPRVHLDGLKRRGLSRGRSAEPSRDHVSEGPDQGPSYAGDGEECILRSLAVEHSRDSGP